MRGATKKSPDESSSLYISIHAPHAGRDRRRTWRRTTRTHFNPRAPRGARRIARSLAKTHKHFNPRAPRGARRQLDADQRETERISIHAPHAGRDFNLPVVRGRRVYFNPRAPRGARRRAKWYTIPKSVFQSTRPARGATHFMVGDVFAFLFQSTRPARGATVLRQILRRERQHFNPRAPRGARPKSVRVPDPGIEFQSTRPARGATPRHTHKFWLNIISIHAPREGRDLSSTLRIDFLIKFQSTRPARGATAF